MHKSYVLVCIGIGIGIETLSATFHSTPQLHKSINRRACAYTVYAPYFFVSLVRLFHSFKDKWYVPSHLKLLSTSSPACPAFPAFLSSCYELLTFLPSKIWTKEGNGE